MAAVLLLTLLVALAVAGCGAGGYPGAGILGFSQSAVVIDAGQAITVTANAGNSTVTWTIAGCSSGSCGTLSGAAGDAITYTGPVGITAPVTLSLQASVPSAPAKSVSVTVNPTLTIQGTLPNGTVGQAYTATIGTKGGTSPVKLSLPPSDSLPGGLTFNAATGVLSGTPTVAGTWSLEVDATDASNIPLTVKVNLTIVISGGAGSGLTVTGNPPAGAVDVAYTTALGASGGTGPYTFSVTSGALPGGLALSSGGVISGTPTAAGSFPFTVQAQDSLGAKGTGNFTITVTGAGLAITTGTLPNGTVGTPYSATVGVSGGTAPYTCTVTTGTLPAGLNMGAGCVVSGTPTAPGTVSLTVHATDSSNPALSANGPVSLTINPAALSIGTGGLPNGTVGTPYSATIPVTGGTTPYTCTVTTGTLPAGLSMGAGCVVSGTPTTAGTVTLGIHATDSGNPALSANGTVNLTINPAALSIGTGGLPNGTVGTAYSATIPVSGGTAPYTCTVTTGALPAGLTMGAGCVVSGTPTTAGTVTLGIHATDSGNPALSANGTVSITINPAALSIGTGGLPNGTVGTAYSATIPVSGGTAPYTCTVTTGALPAGLSMAAGCVVSGTPTTAGTVTVGIHATDSSAPAMSADGPVSITINPAALAISTGTLPNGTEGTPYSATIGVSGGTSPYSCTITSGTLPAGLSMGAGCVVSGTPTAPGTATVSVHATDSSNPAMSANGPVSITINPASLAIATGTLPNGTVGTPYSAAIGMSGGTSPYTCTITSGALPAGLNLGADCVVSGTPTTPGTATIGIHATDSSTPAMSANGSVSLTINPSAMSISTGTLPNGTVGTAYTATVGVSGGTGPYTCTITSGILPSGLTMGAGCVVSGTPTVAETQTVTVHATDSSNPANAANGPVSITINPATATLVLTNPPAATVGTPYTGSIGVSGGTAPYSCTITAGTLPAGLTLGANCALSGTPTTPGSSTVTVHATDASNPAQNTTGQATITVNPASATLTLSNPPPATIGSPYTGSIGVSGGTAPYSCTITGGTLPDGMTLGPNCALGGTPTATAASSTVTVHATDSSNPVASTTGPVTVTVNPASATLTLSPPPPATVGQPYTGTIGVSGGTGPYSCTITAGTLPAGLTLGAGCVVSGTPTTPGAATVTVQATDSSTPAKTASGPVTVTVNAGTLTLSNPPAATAGTPYTGTIGVSGGLAPYNCVLASGTLPAGLTLGANCTITGTPTTPGTATVNITATDSETPAATTTGPVAITVNPMPVLTLTGSLPNATVGVAYTQTLHASGGMAPYTYAITAGTLPPGLTMSTAGVISGTPTAPGASSFTVTATDSETPAQTASLPLVLLVVYPTTAQDGLLNGPYAFLFQGFDDAVLGVLNYQTATIGSFTADGTGVISAGERDSNHQTSNPTGTTVGTRTFVGTYTIGADNRGSLTITTMNANGTAGTTATYAIDVKGAIAPATTSAGGSMIEFDNNQLAGTKGTGQFLQQTPGAYAAGLNGNYAFGMQGDTPCLPACSVGLVAGPVAAVGQFSANGAGAITAGTSDANVSQTNYPNNALAGTYGAADGNGRIALSLTTGDVSLAQYPVDYAIYMVNANQAFVMSTDKHSSYILLAGSMHAQSGTFNNATMNGAYVGYENSPTNPGLVGATLQNVASLSTSTIFRGTGNGTGTCTTTNVDVGGTTGLVNGLTGLGSGSNVLNALLGTYQSTGNSACTVAANGRGVLNYPVPGGVLTSVLQLLGLSTNPPAPRVAYFWGPNEGYFLETGYAGLGYLEAQTGAPFSLATLNGTYVYQQMPAASAASTDTSGTFTADGAGHTTNTYDLNVGVGTVNLLQLGATGNQNYTLTDPTAGRYLLGTTTVIYAIAPGRFVLLDTNPLITSPSVALLY